MTYMHLTLFLSAVIPVADHLKLSRELSNEGYVLLACCGFALPHLMCSCHRDLEKIVGTGAVNMCERTCPP